MKKDNKIVSLINHKGGVGKSTFTLYLSHYKKSVQPVVVDLDSSVNTSFFFTGDYKYDYDVIDFLNGKAPKYFTYSNINLIAGNKAIESFGTEFAKVKNSELILKSKIDKIKSELIILDCPVVNNELLTSNIIHASDVVIIPTQITEFSISGIDSILNTIKQLKPNIAVYVLPNFYYPFSILPLSTLKKNDYQNKKLKEIDETFKDEITLLAPVVFDMLLEEEQEKRIINENSKSFKSFKQSIKQIKEI